MITSSSILWPWLRCCIAGIFIVLPFLLATAHATERVALQLSWDHQFQFAGYYAAKWQGYYREAGLEVEILSAATPGGNVNAVEEVRRGRADFGVGAADILVAHDQGPPLLVLASIFQYSATGFYYKKETRLETLQDLLELTVARRLGDPIDVEFRAMLLGEGIHPDSVALYTDQAGLEQFFNGKIDLLPGYVLNVPFEAVRRGVAVKSLRPSSYGVNFYGDSLFTSQKKMDEDPGLVERFTRASLKGWQYALVHKEEIVERIVDEFKNTTVKSQQLAFNTFQSKEIVGLMNYPVVEIGHINPDRWQLMHNYLQEAGIVSRNLDTSTFLFQPEKLARDRAAQLQQRLVIAFLVAVGILIATFLWTYTLRIRVAEKTRELSESKELVEKSEERLSLALNAASDAVWDWRPDTGEVHLSDGWFTILGYDPGEYPHNYQTWLRLLHPEDRARTQETVKKYMGQDSAFSMEFRLRAKDGGWRWLLGRGRVVERSAHGRALRMIGTNVDITKRKIAEVELREKEQMHVRTEAVAQIGSWQWDLASDTVRWSEQLFAIFGRSPKQKAPTFSEHKKLFLPADMARFDALVEKAVQNAGPFTLELRGRHRDGSLIDCHVEGFPKYDESGKIVGLYGFFQDITEKKQARQKLIQLAHDQGVILDNVPSLIYFKDRKDTIVKVSESVARLSGLTREDIEGKPTSEIYPQLELTSFQDDLEVIETGLAKTGIEEVLPMPNGEKHYLLTDKFPYYDQKGEIAGVLVIAADTTKRVAAESALAASEERFRSLFTHGADAIYLLGMDGVILDANVEACNQTGYNLMELLGLPLSTLDEVEDAEKDWAQYFKNLKKGEILTVNRRHCRNDDTSFPVEIRISLVSLALEQHVLGFVRDMSEKEAILAELRQSEERMALALKGANDGLWDWQVEKDQIFFSPRWKSMLDYLDEELENSFGGWQQLVVAEDWPRLRQALDSCVRGEQESFSCEFQMLAKDGRVVDVLSRAFAIRDQTGKALRIIGTHVDITERKNMEKRLQQVQKLESIGTLAGGIAHDFNNILTSIIGFTELALEDVVPGSDAEDSLEEVHFAGRRARDLVKQILSFARKTDGKLTPVVLGSVAREVMKFLRSSSPATIEFKHDIRSASRVLANPTQLHQVLMNICTNAVQAMEDCGGELTVKVADLDAAMVKKRGLQELDSQDYIEVTVIDTGYGISPEVLNSIFDPYFTTKSFGEGTGLGLAVAHGIVESYGGTIRVESEVGKGSVFRLFFPLTEEEALVETAALEDLPKGTEAILFVDDEPGITRVAKKNLEGFGYTVTISESSSEALAMFRENPEKFDLVISDVTMPNMTGDFFARELLKIKPQLPIILCSGFSKHVSEENARELGVKAFVQKPLMKAELATVIRQVLDGNGTGN